MMTDEQALSRPIGWWLKEAGARLDAVFDRSLQGCGLDRRGWQVLASLARRPTRLAELICSLSSFDPPAAVEAVVDDLTSRGWIGESAGLLRLTPVGDRQYADLSLLIDDVRGQVAAALPQEEYLTLVRLLQRLVVAL